jgi:hypothetical protein
MCYLCSLASCTGYFNIKPGSCTHCHDGTFADTPEKLQNLAFITRGEELTESSPNSAVATALDLAYVWYSGKLSDAYHCGIQ